MYAKNGGYLDKELRHLSDALTEARKRTKRLEEALRLCMARAGHPDPAEGCRLVIATARDALEDRAADRPS